MRLTHKERTCCSGSSISSSSDRHVGADAACTLDPARSTTVAKSPWADHIRSKPWKVDTFKVSNDPRFEEKLVDVVGLYLDPPQRAAVFCFDEKTQCQALDRTQPSLPMKPGRAGTMTHDYRPQRHHRFVRGDECRDR